jgi:uncharacterized paraquat-inducible protein A
MTFVHTWVAGAAILAILFGATCNVKDGDYIHATTILLCAALWPVSIAMGVGFMLRDLALAMVRFIKRRAA